MISDLAKTLILLLFLQLVKSAPQNGFESKRQSLAKGNGLTRDKLMDLTVQTPFQLSAGINGFSSALMNEITNDPVNNNKNIIFSPFSVHTALSMLFYASPNASTTHRQLANVLGLDSNKGHTYLFNYLKLLRYYDGNRKKYNSNVGLVNRIFTRDDFAIKQNYRTLLAVFYLTTVGQFTNARDAETMINNFVNRSTRGKIDQFLAPGSLDGLTRSVLVNAIYYKADWKYQFDPKATTHMEYNLLGGQGKIFHLRGMRIESKRLRIAEAPELNSRVLELPYQNSDFIMYVVVPNDNTLAALNSAAESFDHNRFKSRLKSYSQGLLVTMPAFKASFETELVPALENLGVTNLFDERRAELGDMTNETVAITNILHMATVTVDEEGSEAAAATGIVVGIRSGGSKPSPKIFNVDRPFVLVIHDKRHNVPLFVGRIVNPAGQNNPGAAAATAHNVETQYDTLAVASDDSSEGDNVEPLALAEDCGELGYQEVSHSDSVSFPCKGRETLPLRKHESRKSQNND